MACAKSTLLQKAQKSISYRNPAPTKNSSANKLESLRAAFAPIGNVYTYVSSHKSDRYPVSPVANDRRVAVLLHNRYICYIVIVIVSIIRELVRPTKTVIEKEKEIERKGEREREKERLTRTGAATSCAVASHNSRVTSRVKMFPPHKEEEGRVR